MKKTIALLLAMIFVIGLLAACTPSNTTQDPVQTDDPNAGTPAETTTPTDAPVTEPTAEGKKVYYSVLSSDHSSLNFLDNVDSPVGNVATYCMSYLYRQYPNEEGNGYIWICDIAAEEPIQIDDYNWQIKIREDAKWNNGDPINADTFMFTFKQQLDPVMMPRMSTFLASNAITIVNAEQYSMQNSEGGIPTDWEDVGI